MMKITLTNNYSYLPIKQNQRHSFVTTTQDLVDFSYKKTPEQNISFGWNPIKKLKDYNQYKKAQAYADQLYEYAMTKEGKDNVIFRHYKMEPLEGLQYGIKVFDGLTMKDIQYLSEGLHVIAVKRGCTNMCAHCYADAKPQNREMSWEDFTKITKGFKQLQERLHGLDIWGSNMPYMKDNLLFKSVELFYDADCMNMAIKDKNGKIYDFTDLATELNESLGRKTVFDTAGWQLGNERMQKRAEKYAEYFSKKENMDKLNQFNLSFNVFNATYVASRRALKAKDYDKAKRLREKFTNNVANAIFTFTPVIENPKFGILQRCFNGQAKNAEGFNPEAMGRLIREVITKVNSLYLQDLNGEKKYIKNKNDYERKLRALGQKMNHMDTGLNSSGRMLKFMDEFKIKVPMQDFTESTKEMIDDLKENGRHHKFVMHKLIDTDGKVYHMDYARFFPTEIQLNLENKDTPSPRLANIIDSFVIKKDLINK